MFLAFNSLQLTDMQVELLLPWDVVFLRDNRKNWIKTKNKQWAIFPEKYHHISCSIVRFDFISCASLTGFFVIPLTKSYFYQNYYFKMLFRFFRNLNCKITIMSQEDVEHTIETYHRWKHARDRLDLFILLFGQLTRAQLQNRIILCVDTIHMQH